jgi:hypothetical protein
MRQLLFELRVDRKCRQLVKTHAWLRYHGASARLGEKQRHDMLRAAENLVWQLEGKNP